jgi:hypothetical protein
MLMLSQLRRKIKRPPERKASNIMLVVVNFAKIGKGLAVLVRFKRQI